MNPYGCLPKLSSKKLVKFNKFNNIGNNDNDLKYLPLISMNLGNLHFVPAQGVVNWGPQLALPGWRVQRSHRSPLLDLR
jgi:hypothetical protein